MKSVMIRIIADNGTARDIQRSGADSIADAAEAIADSEAGSCCVDDILIMDVVELCPGNGSAAGQAQVLTGCAHFLRII